MNTRAHRFRGFHGSIPYLCFPLSTLRRVEYSRRLMTRSKPGPLRLGCSGLSPPTYRQLSEAVRQSRIANIYRVSILSANHQSLPMAGQRWVLRLRIRGSYESLEPEAVEHSDEF